MVFVQDFEEFLDKSRGLISDDPVGSRFTVKYRNVDSEAVMKVTNDTQVSP